MPSGEYWFTGVKRFKRLLAAFDPAISAKDRKQNCELLSSHRVAVSSRIRNYALPDDEGNVNIVFLGSLRPYTLPYMIYPIKDRDVNLFAALDRGWIELDKGGTVPRLVLRKALQFAGRKAQFVSFSNRLAAIHYVYNKNRKFDQEIESSSVPAAACGDFELLVNDKVASMVVFKEKQLASPEAVAFANEDMIRQKLDLIRGIYERGIDQRRVIPISASAKNSRNAAKKAIVAGLRCLPSHDLVVKPALGARGKGIQVHTNRKAAAKQILSVVLKGDNQSNPAGEVTWDVVVESLVRMPLDHPWNIRVLAGTDATGAIQTYGELARNYHYASNKSDKSKRFQRRQPAKRFFSKLDKTLLKLGLLHREQNALFERIEALATDCIKKLLCALPRDPRGRPRHQDMAGLDIVISAEDLKPYLIEANGIGSGGIQQLVKWCAGHSTVATTGQRNPVAAVLKNIIAIARGYLKQLANEPR